MTTSHSQLVFLPAPGAGHLPPTVALATLLLRRHHRLSATIIIMKLPHEPKTRNPTNHHRLNFIQITCEEESTKNLNTPKTFVTNFIENQKRHVANIVRGLLSEPDSARLAGFVVDMFYVPMIDVANEFGAPTYVYFTSNAGALGLILHLQAKHDDEGYDVTELKDSDSEVSVPSYVNPVPARVLPTELLDKEGGCETFIGLARRFRESKGIIVNTFHELETHGVDFLTSRAADVPPVFAVGPILNVEDTRRDDETDEVLRWLDGQPEGSVVFLCFGSMGCFDEEQVKEIAVALERSGRRFLWSLRRPPPPKEKMGHPTEYESPQEVLPEGFLDRTSDVGRVIGWAPQMAVLSHRATGGFVSHCGWNSVLESVWCGVPVAAWPLYAEQQVNAFELVVELGMAVEIRMDYRTNMRNGGSEAVVTAEEIESGIRRLMSDGEMREKVKEMKEKSKMAVSDGGSSDICVRRFIHHVMAMSEDESLELV